MQVAVPSTIATLRAGIGDQPPAPQPRDPETNTEAAHIRAHLFEAVAVLRVLFEDGCGEANAARAGHDQAGRIAGHRSGIEQRYCIGDAATDPRFVALFVSVPAVDGHIFGGAYINSSRTSPSIYLVPRMRGDATYWTVSATGAPFTVRVVRDLFAGVFGEDVAASARLAPLVGYDLFQTPWS